MDQVYKDLDAIELRIYEIRKERDAEIQKGQQEVKDLEELLEETKKRVSEESSKHSAVVNEASTVLSSLKGIRPTK